ncbi:hypothetical protein [Gluconobacter morbifer]|uniref:Uncharacterized protein n=1 Tax=Gluconobacter morbifer G707 TaxID=1088869 RepID=G6XMC4_9PROT|nr:hypothetical protein [Gluconobacter morbifer]EHH67022.1 hypothetical protein GMO_26420 [Gluconobacter morbifer G707]
MDRAIVYAGSVPLDTDLLRVGRHGKSSIGQMADMVYGSGVTAATGLTCALSSDSLAVTVGAGSITAPGVMDVQTLGGNGGGLEADGATVTCQYINPAAQTVMLVGSGATYTVFAVCSEQDVDQTLLPFFNVSNPAQTQAGIGNDGTALPTRRQAGMTFVVSTVAPQAPAGGCVVALYTLTVAQGVTTLAGITPQPERVSGRRFPNWRRRLC